MPATPSCLTLAWPSPSSLHPNIGGCWGSKLHLTAPGVKNTGRQPPRFQQPRVRQRCPACAGKTKGPFPTPGSGLEK